MTQSALYPPVYVLGNGQLGRMLQYAGKPLDIDVIPLAFDAQPINITTDALITAEIEQWPLTPLTEQLSSHHQFINQPIFAQLADRTSQKTLLDSLNLATSPWISLNHVDDWKQGWDKLGGKAVAKLRRGGYDGRGQWIVEATTIEQIPAEFYSKMIAEAFIPFDYEVSIVGARFADGRHYFYPVTRNLQQNGILRYSVTDKSLVPNRIQQQAEKMLTAILDELKYVGVMAMECFVVNGELLINELAPRVHNSGHWTQLGCSISQFELHLRALLNLPTPKLETFMPSVMINLIGTEHNPNWLNYPFSQLHWYGKEVRPGRKLGHINLSHPDANKLIEILELISKDLPDDYLSGIEWTTIQLKQVRSVE